jgi:hypothetical protein
MSRLILCPDDTCGALAEATDSVVLGGTGGPLEHVRTRCLNGHTFVLPANRLIDACLPEQVQPQQRSNDVPSRRSTL